MTDKKTGGPAFPHSRLGSDHDGMQLRDYFAAKAIQGVLSSPSNPASFAYLAEWSYAVADAMLEARSK